MHIICLNLRYATSNPGFRASHSKLTLRSRFGCFRASAARRDEGSSAAQHDESHIADCSYTHCENKSNLLLSIAEFIATGIGVCGVLVLALGCWAQDQSVMSCARLTSGSYQELQQHLHAVGVQARPSPVVEFSRSKEICVYFAQQTYVTIHCSFANLHGAQSVHPARLRTSPS